MTEEFTKSDNRWKWFYAYILLAVTIGWAVFSVLVIRNSIMTPTAINVLEASGASVLLGALIPLNVNVNQYFFRKKPTEEN